MGRAKVKVAVKAGIREPTRLLQVTFCLENGFLPDSAALSLRILVDPGISGDVYGLAYFFQNYRRRGVYGLIEDLEVKRVRTNAEEEALHIATMLRAVESADLILLSGSDIQHGGALGLIVSFLTENEREVPLVLCPGPAMSLLSASLMTTLQGGPCTSWPIGNEEMALADEIVRDSLWDNDFLTFVTRLPPEGRGVAPGEEITIASPERWVEEIRMSLEKVNINNLEGREIMYHGDVADDHSAQVTSAIATSLLPRLTDRVLSSSRIVVSAKPAGGLGEVAWILKWGRDDRSASLLLARHTGLLTLGPKAMVQAFDSSVLCNTAAVVACPTNEELDTSRTLNAWWKSLPAWRGKAPVLSIWRPNITEAIDAIRCVYELTRTVDRDKLTCKSCSSSIPSGNHVGLVPVLVVNHAGPALIECLTQSLNWTDDKFMDLLIRTRIHLIEQMFLPVNRFTSDDVLTETMRDISKNVFSLISRLGSDNELEDFDQIWPFQVFVANSLLDMERVKRSVPHNVGLVYVELSAVSNNSIMLNHCLKYGLDAANGDRVGLPPDSLLNVSVEASSVLSPTCKQCPERSIEYKFTGGVGGRARDIIESLLDIADEPQEQSADQNTGRQVEQIDEIHPGQVGTAPILEVPRLTMTPFGFSNREVEPLIQPLGKSIWAAPVEEPTLSIGATTVAPTSSSRAISWPEIIAAPSAEGKVSLDVFFSESLLQTSNVDLNCDVSFLAVAERLNEGLNGGILQKPWEGAWSELSLDHRHCELGVVGPLFDQLRTGDQLVFAKLAAKNIHQGINLKDNEPYQRLIRFCLDFDSLLPAAGAAIWGEREQLWSATNELSRWEGPLDSQRTIPLLSPKALTERFILHTEDRISARGGFKQWSQSVADCVLPTFESVSSAMQSASVLVLPDNNRLIRLGEADFSSDEE